jgi:hypothetical protein
MSKALVVTLLIALVVVIIGAIRYLTGSKHQRGRNVGSAAEHHSPQDPWR